MKEPLPTPNPNITIKEYRKLRRKLKTLEEDNFDSIIAIPVDGKEGWYEVAEHSALIYYYEVCVKLNRKTHFFADDRSFYDQYEIGYMRSKGLGHIKKGLEKVGLLKNESQIDSLIHVFHLNFKYESVHLTKLQNQEFARRAENIAPLPTNNLDPELFHALTTTSRRLHSICSSRLDHLASETNGQRIVTVVDQLLKDYHRLTMLRASSMSRQLVLLERMRSSAYDLILEIKILGDAKLWSFELCTSVGEQVGLIKNRIEAALKKALKSKNATSVAKTTEENPENDKNATFVAKAENDKNATSVAKAENDKNVAKIENATSVAINKERN